MTHWRAAKLVVGYEFAGPQQVKNIAEPVPAFRVKLDATLEPTWSRVALLSRRSRPETVSLRAGA